MLNDPPLSKRNTFLEFRRSWLSLFFLLILSACGPNAAGSQSIFTPIRPDPTTTSALNLSSPNSRPTSVVSELVTINNYTHPSTRFSINYPANWQSFERPDGVVFIDPGDEAGYSVFFSDAGQRYSEQELNQYLVTFVAQNFANKDKDFSAMSQETLADGSIVAQFSGLDPNLGQAINEIRVSQQETIVFVVLMSASQEQWALSRRKLQELADTLVVLDTSPAQNVEPTGEAPVWDLIGPASNKFGFLSPSDWETLRQDDSSVLVVMPETEFSFEATVSPWTGSTTDFEAVAAATLDYVSSLDDIYTDVSHLPPAEFPLSGSAGATIDFLYTRQDGLEIAGSVVMAVEEGQLYRIVFSAPAKFYEGALQWFNPMLQSFTILSPEDFIVNE